MKKTFKKLFAALLAAALVLAMAVPAFAVTNATKGSITISNTVKDETYTIYRMFKLDSYNAESNTYSYTVESDWEGFFKTGAGGNYITLDGQNHPTWTAADETIPPLLPHLLRQLWPGQLIRRSLALRKPQLVIPSPSLTWTWATTWWTALWVLCAA